MRLVDRIPLLVVAVLAGLATVHADEPNAPRTPETVARELLDTYGHSYQNSYIPSLAAIVARLRFAELTGDASHKEIVLKALPSELPQPRSGPQLAGQLIFAEAIPLVDEESRKRYIDHIIQTADAVEGPSPQEMSDAVFMCGPILCEATACTGETKYFDKATEFLAAMRELRVREDGLYAHGHRCDAAWGRGNGFPALGTSWCLSVLPEDHPGREALLAAFRQHIDALIPHQDADGLWHQVIDHPESYAEFSCTSMIGFAIQRGLARGWLKGQQYEQAADRAWRAIDRRIEPGGRLIDVCEGTGTQASLEAYLNRKAIRGVDHRGGAMALMFATERMAAGR